MTADDYATLMDFLATRFARMDASFAALDARMARMEARQDAMEERLARAEVLREAMRDDIRRIAEGLMAVNERLDRFQAEMRTRLDEHDLRFEEHDRRFDSLDRVLGGVQVHFDRFAVDFGTVQLDHGARIEALERHRRRREPGG